MKRIFFALHLMLLLQLFPTLAHAQTTLQEQQVRRELERRNIDEQELRQRLLAQGINVDTMSPAELAAAQPIIEQVIAEIEAEQAAEAASAKREVRTDTLKQASTQLKEDTTTSQVDVKSEKIDSLNSDQIDIWGHHVFNNNSFKLIEAANNSSKTPRNYLLGSGDVIGISIYGTSQADLKLPIKEDGFIRPAKMPRIYLKGLTLSKAKTLLEKRFRQYYIFQSGQFSVSVDAPRTITVNIFGEAKQNGSYTISAVNTLFNALAAAGGPTESGSVRNIKLLRNGKETIVDLYEYLLNPVKQQDLFLADNDIIFIPLADNLVQVKGAVKRPIRYELKQGETLDNAIAYAGGLLPAAVSSAITIRRIEDSQEQVVDGNYGQQETVVKNGDVILVPASESPEINYVSISGDVLVPGDYAFVEGMRMTDLLKKAGIKRSSRLDVGFLRRTNADSTTTLIPVSYFASLEDPTSSEILQSGDQLIVFSQITYARPATIAVSGAVHTPISGYPFSNDGQMTVEDALLLAGGQLENASNRAFLIRKNPENLEQQQYVSLQLDQTDALRQNLRPFDSLVVYTNERFTDAFPVSIRGAVRKTGDYNYDPSLGLKELITLAGGLKLEAARNRIDIFRLQLSQTEAAKTITTALEIDDDFNIIGGVSNFDIQPYDVIVVRSVPEFEFIQSVNIVGEVRYPGDYALDNDNLRLSDLVEKAGGLTAEAFPSGATLYRDIKDVGVVIIDLDKVLKDPSKASNIVLKNGDQLRIPKSKDLVTIHPTGTQATKYLSDSLYRDGSIDVAFSGNHSAKWYINNYTAGFADNAKRRSLTVQHANGELERTKHFLFFKFYPVVYPGSTIRMDLQAPKKERKKREKPIDWVGTTQAVLGSITTTLTVYLLIKELN